jgi:hypothetical protein
VLIANAREITAAAVHIERVRKATLERKKRIAQEKAAQKREQERMRGEDPLNPPEPIPEEKQYKILHPKESPPLPYHLRHLKKKKGIFKRLYEFFVR